MPLHDWDKVEPNEFHHFHGRWIYALADTLNDGLLPPGYMALGDYSLREVIPDVITLGQQPPTNTAPHSSGGATTLMTMPPSVQFVETASPKKAKSRQRRLQILQTRNRQVVAVIEIVSPSNKASEKELTNFINKSVAYLQSGIHFLLLDVFPTSKHPLGLPGMLWKQLVGRKLNLPEQPTTSRYFCSVRALGDEYTAYTEPVQVEQKLPTMPLFLTSEQYVSISLEDTYQTAYANFPAMMKEQLEGPKPSTGS